MSRTKQTIDGLTVEAIPIEGAGKKYGPWWVWKNSEGKQVHAGMAPQQFVVDRFYVLRDGKWQRAEG